MSKMIDNWLEAQRINGGSHGFECIGIARMQQVWDAAQEDLIKQLATQEIVKQGEIDMLKSMNDDLRQQLAEYKGSYENACNLVARMHAAAVGEVTGPRRGVVEDVEDMRQQLAATADLDQYILCEKNPRAWSWENKVVKGNWYISWREPKHGYNKTPLYRAAHKEQGK